MKIIISPAKKLDTCNNKLSKKMNFSLINEAQQLIDLLQKKTPKEVKTIMGLSDNLTNLNVARFNEWDVNNLNTFNAIFMFQGDVYKGLSAHTFSEREMDFAQANLRILSGLYGILKPLDVILPYRLEMGTKIKNEFGNNLYDYWNGKLQASLTNEMKKGDFLVNLASNEYSKALKLTSFPYKVITPIFKDFKNGKLKIISFYAKRARGEMCNFIIRNRIKNISDLKLFNHLGYSYQEENDEMIFVR